MSNYIPIPKVLTTAFNKAVTDYLLIETEVAPADLIMVFGNSARETLALKAFDLYQKGLAPQILVSGGVYQKHEKTEAIDIRDRLIALGVPAADILVENKATNTGENVKYSKKLIAGTIGLENVKSIVAVGHVTASRRFLMTLKSQWPGVFAMIAPANPYAISKDKWYTFPKFKEQVLNEYKKIPSYTQKGFIKEIDVAAINRRAGSIRSSKR